MADNTNMNTAIITLGTLGALMLLILSLRVSIAWEARKPTRKPCPVDREPAPTPALPPKALGFDVTQASVLQLDDGDILVLRTPGRLSQAAKANVEAKAEGAFPGMKVVVLEEGMSIDVIRQAAMGPTSEGTEPTRG